jgi:hypothetical protein
MTMGTMPKLVMSNVLIISPKYKWDFNLSDQVPNEMGLVSRTTSSAQAPLFEGIKTDQAC